MVFTYFEKHLAFWKILHFVTLCYKSAKKQQNTICKVYEQVVLPIPKTIIFLHYNIVITT